VELNDDHLRDQQAARQCLIERLEVLPDIPCLEHEVYA